GGDGPAGAKLAYSRGSDPTLESARRKFAFRSVSFGFGLEGVNGAAGTATGAAVLARAAAWLLDEVRVKIVPGADSAFRADAVSTARAPVVRYRWDFGDGERITTAAHNVRHLYRPGTYTLRVEALDTLGHTNVASRRVVVSG
ncbi:MAG: PKD domain-containing protein, partial [Actinomycetota bacterium]